MNRERRQLCEDIIALDQEQPRDLAKMARRALRLARHAPAPLRRLALDVVVLNGDQDAAPSLSDMARRAHLALVSVRRKEAREADHLQESARLWLKVQRRAGGRCELCDGPEIAADQLALHHLEGGHGSRRERQTERNTMAAHQTCHAAWHLNPKAFVEKVRTWCERYGYPLPRRKEFRT